MIIILTRNYIPRDDIYIFIYNNREKSRNSNRSHESRESRADPARDPASRAGFLKKSGFAHHYMLLIYDISDK
jgi:hypothetical protein